MGNGAFWAKAADLSAQEHSGSYTREDCVFLLKDVGGLVREQGNDERERSIQGGRHYSSMLPVEYEPPQPYIGLFLRTLGESAPALAGCVATLSEAILRRRGRDAVLVSLARAGTPVGVLVRRYLKFRHGLELPHYSVSIIRDIGIDENAIVHIVARHGGNLQFIDGWTGKGVIASELRKAAHAFREKYAVELDGTLAVLSDPGCCTELFATREDLLIPNACLNATVSGLASRTFYRADVIGEHEFHGAKFYMEYRAADLSARFVDAVSACFPGAVPDRAVLGGKHEATFAGARQIEAIKRGFGIPDDNRVKPGVGETTRVLLRRVPWKVLVRGGCEARLAHVLMLANERNVTVERYDEMGYSCCGLIRDMLHGE